MNRRQLILSFGAGLSGLNMGTARAQNSNGTPPSTAGGRPAPVKIADNLVVTDYRFGLHGIGSPDLHQAFVELASPASTVLESPLGILMTVLDHEANIIWEYNAPTQTGLIGGGYSDFPFIQFSSEDFNPEEDSWHSVSFTIPSGSEWNATPALYDPMAYVIEDLVEERGDDYWIGEGMVRNDTDSPVAGLHLFTVFRESDGRFAGFDRSQVESEIPAGKAARFRIDVGRNTAIPLDPFQFISDDQYEVHMFAK